MEFAAKPQDIIGGQGQVEFPTAFGKAGNTRVAPEGKAFSAA